MFEKSYLILPIFCALWSQGLTVISNENIEKSSDLHIRKKRIIDNAVGGVQFAHVTMSRHIVQILEGDTFACAGNILKANIILTVSSCIQINIKMYSVLSDSSVKNHGIPHRILADVKHPNSNIALLRIDPPITLSRNGSDKINFFTGFLPKHTSGRFSGWGCTYNFRGDLIYPERLMSTLLPIITYEQCQRASRISHGRILPPDAICTLDQRGIRSACNGDEGGSLVYLNRLLGIYSYNQGVNLGVHPEVYVSLINVNIVEWVNQNLRKLRAHRLRNHGWPNITSQRKKSLFF